MKGCSARFLLHMCAHRRLKFAVVACLGAFVPIFASPIAAGTTFATPVFQEQWQLGESLVTNFWGANLSPTSVRHEAYDQSPGGTRLVQYFDKGRMELSRPTSTTATNGLLTVELLRGQIQTGDSTYENHGPANIPIAGDPTNAGPTFAMLQQKQAALLNAGASKMGAAVTRAVTTSGASSTYPEGADYPKATVAAYDSATGHNVSSAFATFRAQVGVSMTGLAVSEPFWSTVTVGGVAAANMVTRCAHGGMVQPPSTSHTPKAFALMTMSGFYTADQKTAAVNAIYVPDRFLDQWRCEG